MRGLLLSLLVLSSAVSVVAQAQIKATVARWPQDRVAAISLTFDDALATHLDVAGPILKKHRLNGTFFVSTGLGVWEKRKEEWEQLTKDGNELGDHTVHHPCLLPEIEPHSQGYTAEMMQSEIQTAAQEIRQLSASNRGLTFAYPWAQEREDFHGKCCLSGSAPSAISHPLGLTPLRHYCYSTDRAHASLRCF